MDVCIIDLGFQKFLDGKTSNDHNFLYKARIETLQK